MSITKFEQLIAWQKAQDLAVLIYDHLKSSKEFTFKDQIIRAVISISNNLAEGFDRGSKKDFLRFLYIAKASGSEVKSMLYLSPRLNIMDDTFANKLMTECDEVCKIIGGLIKSTSNMLDKP